MTTETMKTVMRAYKLTEEELGALEIAKKVMRALDDEGFDMILTEGGDEISIKNMEGALSAIQECNCKKFTPYREESDGIYLFFEIDNNNY